ncbi:neutral zinc metallopeptidase [Roseococcus sp. SYP-B2431]|uniref:KPN_02809 family neutral zinc metallopeptidase n=1 Tax=Roseococcus sp. SYP-B2431 TaxID=2496640 RepID=UPI001F0FD8A4|nr:neutral zinc metallopeptidase [Roseococcus sp. SYP-B2431]
MDNERESANLEDRRGGGFGGGGRGGFPIGRAGGIGGFGLVAVVVISLLFGVDPSVILGGLEGGGAPSPGYQQQQPQQQARGPAAPQSDEAARFVSRVLASTEDVWTAEFARSGRRYQAPRLVLFSGAVQSGCGAAQSAMGPFYCPADQRVYLDLSFFREMQQRLGAPGDFAQAYVIAHEVGHHVQNLLGILARSQQAQQQSSQRDANAVSVRTELMADCLAGFWARRAQEMRNILEQGDIEEGMGAAAAVGDDRLQSRGGRGQVVPESFTHGSSAQRVQSFKTGMAAQDAGACINRR